MSTACDNCPQDTYVDTTKNTLVANCKACPVGKSTNGRVGQTSRSSCVCPNEKYLDPTDLSCKDCPTGGVCDLAAGTTLKTIKTMGGWWRRSHDSPEFYECEDNPDVCLGGNFSTSCYEGHALKFPYCAVCESNGYLGVSEDIGFS